MSCPTTCAVRGLNLRLLQHDCVMLLMRDGDCLCAAIMFEGAQMTVLAGVRGVAALQAWCRQPAKPQLLTLSMLCSAILAKLSSFNHVYALQCCRDKTC